MNQETGESTEATSPKRSETEAKSEAWISAQEAARILGISERAVQLRAQKGTLPSRRDGSRWYVRLEKSTEAPKVFAESEAKRAEVESESSESVSPKRSEEAEADEALFVPHLLEEIAFLRSELTAQREAADVEKSEMRRLMMADKQELQELRQKVALLIVDGSPGRSAVGKPESGTHAGRRPEGVSLDATGAPGVTADDNNLPDVAESKPDPLQGAPQNLTEPDRSRPHMADDGGEPPRRRWWKFWERG